MIWLASLWVAVMTVLFACGDDGNETGDTVLTGFSGVLIFGVVAWVVWSYVKKRR